MHPELFTLSLPLFGEVTVSSYGAMLVAAFLLGHWVIRVRLKELERDPYLAGDVMIAALVGGVVGAKLYYVLLHWDAAAADPLGLLLARGGLIWYGGFIGGALAVLYLTRLRDVAVWEMGDLVAPALALGYGVGRIGCFLVGDDYGRPTESWVGIAFPEGSPPTTAGSLRRWFGVDVPAGVPDSQVLQVYPTQIFEAVAGIAIFILLWRWRKHVHRSGWLFSVWLVAAGLERLFIEVFRAKDDRFFGPFTMAQVMSVALVAVGVYLWLRFRRPSGATSDV